LKTTIRTARLKAGLAVNRELVLLYWRIGKEILERQSAQGWGAKVIDQLARDLRAEFPDMRGFSRTNLLYMRAFASAWPEEAIVHQLGGQIPWRHNCVIIDQVKNRPTREWYIRKTIENGWSRSVLELQIETAAHRRVGAAQTNFDRALPSPQSDLARDILKDPYTFDFLGITDASNERTIEKALLLRLRDFLIELGVGFAFVGSQYRLEVDGDEFFMDLLFYHTRLHCYVVSSRIPSSGPSTSASSISTSPPSMIWYATRLSMRRRSVSCSARARRERSSSMRCVTSIHRWAYPPTAPPCRTPWRVSCRASRR